MGPKGTLIAIGGGENKAGKDSILRQVIEVTGKKKPHIEVIATATTHPKQTAAEYAKAFSSFGAKADHVMITRYKQLEIKKYTKRLEKCDAVFFTGGDQLRLTTLLGGTCVPELLLSRYDKEKNFVIAGTSAGAAAMSATMIVSGSAQDALIKGHLQLTNGFAFLSNVFIDTHLTQRGRFGRLMQTVSCNPAVLGLGLGEDTAAIIRKGEEIEIRGTGLAIIVDGMDISYSDLTDISDGCPITVEGLRVHVLGKGKFFSLSERKVLHKEKEK
jgi:cyanophycinase